MYGKSVFSDRHPQNQLASRISHAVFSFVSGHVHEKLCLGRVNIEPIIKISHTISHCNVGVASDYQEDLSEEDDDLCPVDCVKEFKTDEELYKILDKVAMISGDPLCHQDQYLSLVQEFETYCKKHHLRVAIVAGSESMAHIGQEHKWMMIRFGTEKVLNPTTNPLVGDQAHFGS